MTKPLKIRNTIIGAGIPKICVPVTGRSREMIRQQAVKIAAAQPDLVEWRADYFEEIETPEAVAEILSTLRGILREIPILFTFRTEKEGGERPIEKKNYVKLNETVAKTGLADAIDVELYLDENVTIPLIRVIQECGCIVVSSNHHFSRTPKREELELIFGDMEKSGADIMKVAVMPRSPEEVLNLLMVTQEISAKSERPVITMSMGGQGVLSRMSGELFGSSVTFAAVEEASAPGQIPIEELRMVLHVLHKSLQ